MTDETKVKFDGTVRDLVTACRQLQAVTAERDRLRLEVARLREVLINLGAWRVDL
jgi:hypothetical protein